MAQEDAGGELSQEENAGALAHSGRMPFKYHGCRDTLRAQNPETVNPNTLKPFGNGSLSDQGAELLCNLGFRTALTHEA